MGEVAILTQGQCFGERAILTGAIITLARSLVHAVSPDSLSL